MKKKHILLAIVLMLLSYSLGFISYHLKLPPFETVLNVKEHFSKNEAKNPGDNYIKEKMSFFNRFNPQGKVAFVGDSLTNGSEWYEIFKSDDIVNLGVGWNTITNISKDPTYITNTHAKTVFIMGGVNDFNVMGYDVASVFNSYKKLITHLNNNNVKIYIQSTLLTRRGDELNDKIKKLNLALSEFCFKTIQCEFIDINKGMAIDGSLIEKYTLDGIHLNGDGYYAWISQIKDYVNNSLEH
ncbi:GDSL-type esterase/lipase family protein [Providencia sp. Je.9.19]|uniref:GDSL-type esterase/lipase family protein n=1 Tax=Providencia sp. Je.9.19 TaxID=3142844 RepID=UPI003DAA01A5